MCSPSRFALVFVLALAFAGCGDAVTDPLRNENFEADPSPIVGAWFVETADGSLDGRFTLTVERGAGVLFGEVLIPASGQTVQLFFSEVDDWDGGSFHFFDSQTFGVPADSLRWTVSLRPRMEIVDRCPTTGEERVRVRPARVTAGTPRVNIGASYRRPGTTPLEDAPPLSCPIDP